MCKIVYFSNKQTDTREIALLFPFLTDISITPLGRKTVTLPTMSTKNWNLVKTALVDGDFEQLTELVLQENARIVRNHNKIKNIQKYVKLQQENLKLCRRNQIGRDEFVRKSFAIWKHYAKLFTEGGQKFGVGIESGKKKFE